MINLHCHDSDSYLDGIGTALQNAEVAAKFGQFALAQTNHSSLSGSLKHIKACEKVGIMPILGNEGYWRPNRLVRDKEWRYRRWHMVLLAKNLKGWHNLIKISSEAFCVTPEMKVLTSDLKWVPCGDLNIGDCLIGFDDNGYKTMKKSYVLKNDLIKRPVYRIKLKDGTILRSSAEHPWLTVYGTKGYKNTQVAWKTTKEIYERYNEVRKQGSLEEIKKRNSRPGARPSRDFSLIRYFYPWEVSQSYDAGYVAGAFDGEGHVSHNSKGKNNDKGGGIHLTFSQNPNAMLDKMKYILTKNNFDFKLLAHRKCNNINIRGRQDQFRLLGSYRPQRLLNKFDQLLDSDYGPLGVMRKIASGDIEEIVFQGYQDVVALETSTGTFICEGFGAHNSSGMYQNACWDWELMEQYKDGIICSTSCVLGPLSFLIQNGTEKEVNDWVEKALKIYDEDFYFSIMPHDFDNQRTVNLELISLANKFGCPIVYEGDSHYPHKGWVETQKIAILIGTNSTVKEAEEQNQKRIENGEEVYELWHDDLHIMEEAEVRAAFKLNHPNIPDNIVDEAIKNTDYIGSKIEPFLMDRSTKMPRAGKGDNAGGNESELKVIEWCWEGMERIEKVGNVIYEKRLEYELEVIKDRGNHPYILLAADWIRWCKSDLPLPGKTEKKRPMLITTRGSAAASLVCYLCNITPVDPIAHKFKFERFINPERKGLPDIDFDFPSRRRNEAKEYLAIKYGQENIADVMAQQHFQPRAALKNVTKVLNGFDSDAYTQISKICHEDSNLIDPVHDIDLEKMRDKIPELNIWADRFPFEWEQAVRFENAGDPWVSRLSRHAAGVILTPRAITNFMPTIRSDEDEIGYRTAWSETPRISIVDDFGFVKIDALGLAGRDKHEMILELYEKRTGKKIDIDALPCLKDPYDVDEKVMNRFQEGLTLGIHQFSGNGITSYMKKANPENIVDLTAINALYRPGPMGEKGHLFYINRKNGKEEFTIPDALKNTLSETYGLMIFQEQVMEIFQVLMGYNLGRADDVRKMIDKENRAKSQTGRAKLDKLKKEFIEKASIIVGLEISNRIWAEVLPYVGYAFNRPHSGCYSVQAYQDQWLKEYLTLEFYSIIMSQNPKDSMRAIKEAKNFGIKILPPDINLSDNTYTPDFENNAIRYGLRGIKGVGDVAADYIMKHRPFTSMEDLEERTSIKYSKCNKGNRKALLKVGALDSLGGRVDWTDEERAEAEMELLGISLSPGGTLGQDEQLIISRTHSEEEVEALGKGDNVVIGGVVAEVKNTVTKKGANPGQKMCFAKVSLGLDSFQCTIFPQVYSSYSDILKTGEKLMVKGRKDDRGIIVQNIMRIDDYVNEIKSQEMVNV